MINTSIKKRLYFIGIFFCTLLLCFNFAIADSGSDNVQEKDKKLYHNIFNQVYTYDNLPTLKLEAYYDDSDSLSQMVKAEYEELLKAIPDEILQKLKAHKLTVYLVYNCKDYWPTGTPPMFLRGFYTGKAIFVSLSNEESCINYLDSVLYHEIGHAVDDYYGHLSRSKGFRTAYKNDCEQENVSSAENYSEGFAEVFNDYMFSLYSMDGTPNYHAMSRVLHNYPRTVEYMQFTLNLNQIYEGYVFPLVKLSRWRIAQRYYNCKKIERISESVADTLYGIFTVIESIDANSTIISNAFEGK